MFHFDSLLPSTPVVIDYFEQDGKLTLRVQVVPRASRSEVVGEHAGALRVRLAAPPVDGAANQELVRLISLTLKVPRSAIEIISGHSSKRKQIRLSGVCYSDLLSLLRSESR